MGIWAYAKKNMAKWGILQKSIKMQLHSKVIAKTFFSQKKPCILPYKGENIKSMFSRQVRDLTQKAKWPKNYYGEHISKRLQP